MSEEGEESEKSYADIRALLGLRTQEFENILRACFANKAALETFVRERFQSVWSRVDWNRKFYSTCYEVEIRCFQLGKIGDFLHVLGVCNPTNHQIPEFICYLVSTGHVMDLRKPPRQSTNQHDTDWLEICGQRNYTPLKKAVREALLCELAVCFKNAAAIEGFILDNFPDFAELANNIRRHRRIGVTLKKILGRLQNLGWQMAFLHAVHQLPEAAECPTLCDLVAASPLNDV